MDIYSLSDQVKSNQKRPRSLGHFELSFPEDEHQKKMDLLDLANDSKVDVDDFEETKIDYIITDIRQAVKNQNRVNIFVNRQFDFSLDLAQVVDFKIKIGKKLSEEELKELREASRYGKLYQQTLEWVLSRPRSIHETRDYLFRKRSKRRIENLQAERNRKRPKEEQVKYKLRTREIPLFSDEDIENVIKTLCERDYLNDEKFAEYYVKNRSFVKGTSRKRLQQELYKKGVDNEIIENALNSSMRSDEEEIKKIVEKKKRHYKTKDKLIAYLVRQGFDYQRAKDVVLEMD